MRKTETEDAPATSVHVIFMDHDEKTTIGEADVAAEHRGFRLPFRNKLYEQGRQTDNGSWIYHDRGL